MCEKDKKLNFSKISNQNKGLSSFCIQNSFKKDTYEFQKRAAMKVPAAIDMVSSEAAFAFSV